MIQYDLPRARVVSEVRYRPVNLGNARSPYRPIGLDLPRKGPKNIGQSTFQEVKFDWANLGQTIMFGAAGAGAIYGSGLLPDPIKTFVMIGGIGLIGYAAYSFVGSSAGAGSSSKSGVKQSKIATPQQFGIISGKFLQPVSGSTEEVGLLGSDYSAQVLVSNPNQDPVDVTFQLLAQEYPGWYFMLPFGDSGQFLAAAKTVTIPAGGNIPIDFTINSKALSFMSPAITVRLVLQKVRTASGNPDDTQTLDVTTAVVKR